MQIVFGLFAIACGTVAGFAAGDKNLPLVVTMAALCAIFVTGAVNVR